MCSLCSSLQLPTERLLSVQHEDAENIGYIIPPPVIEHFITDFQRNACFTAFPSLGIEWQKLENPGMRKSLGMQVGAPRPSLSFDSAKGRLNVCLAEWCTVLAMVQAGCTAQGQHHVWLSPILQCLLSLQTVESCAVWMQAGQKGVRIRRVDPTAPCNEHLKTGDILLSFDGVKIANDGV